jgi:glucosamine--fructose-6-phosphate aminotransferase (isomerizing)
MCGIIGYVGRRPAKERLLSGMRRLEYRGYDSAGICLVEPQGLESVRAVGPLERLLTAAARVRSLATAGIGHTRWATHGRVTEGNAHPLASCDESISIVLNGIVENHGELRAELERDGHRFRSQTDAETVAHLVERAYTGDLSLAVASARDALEGHFAFVAVHEAEPGILVGTRRQCPLVVGVGFGETYLASAIGAFLPETRRAQLVEEEEIVVATSDGARFLARDGSESPRVAFDVDWEDDAGGKAGHETFMLKEIHEQPEAIARTIAPEAHRDELALTRREIRRLGRMVIVSCGTSFHAGLAAGHLIESWAGIPCEVAVASEWRYRDTPLGPRDLVLGITQSGETADTIAALRLARERGARTVAMTNVPGSQATREVESVLMTLAGMEMGVAATKTFTAQVSLLAILALRLAEVRRGLPPARRAELRTAIEALPEQVAAFLRGHHPIPEIAARYASSPFFVFLGRHVGVPAALEGALKLKEIAYIPTEAYPAGEMKHGPIALISESTPVVCVATESHVSDKLRSNVSEVRARGACVIEIATDGDEDAQHRAEDVVYVPRTEPLLAPVVAVLPLQLLAYETARRLGLDVDRPRNLAKTVTVE